MDGRTGVRIGQGEGWKVAPVWLRVLTGLLDTAIVAGGAVGLWGWLAFDPSDLPPRYWNPLDYLVDLVNARPDMVWTPVVLAAAATAVWCALWTATAGSPPVARLAGLRVATGAGHRPGVLRALLRSILAIALVIPGMVGPLWALVSPHRRMLHDVLTGCRVLWGDVPDDWARRVDVDAHTGLSKGPGLFLDGPRR